MNAVALERVIADDLSGAAEAAGALHRRGFATTVVLEGTVPEGLRGVEDLDVRNAPDAETIIERAFADGGPVHYVKIDSQLRGPVSAFIAAAARRAAVVLAPALPAADRTVVDGVPLLGGIPLSTSPASAWRTEAGSAPRRLDDLIPEGLPRRSWSRAQVRSGAFAAHLAGAEIGSVHIPDADSPADLTHIADAVQGASRVIPIGSAGLWEALLPAARTSPPVGDATGVDRAIVLLGSLEPVVHRQWSAVRRDTTLVRATADEGADELSSRIARAGEGAARVIAITAGPADGAHHVRVADLLGRSAAAAVRDHPATALCLIGGETARRALDALGESVLHVIGEIHPGAVLSRTARGRMVVTRPGSFGDDRSLELIISTLLGDAPRAHQEEGPCD